MTTTTIRVDTATHAQLVSLSVATGATLVDTIREATEALRRQRFARRVADELATLHADSDSWATYVAEADASVGDGLG
ncbi:MAG: putative antitoxin MazE7 [Acidimicrobiaceae bacterium]|nr:MAG: putative antitoxin MazE7 [Acidimicrobiaceae bacterium]